MPQIERTGASAQYRGWAGYPRYHAPGSARLGCGRVRHASGCARAASHRREEGGTVPQRYDAVDDRRRSQRAGGAAYLARAGLKTLVLERRHVLGGAAVTEEVFPGFRFSVASYVVSLLRPEIIRDLAAAAGTACSILPLDGTFTPLDDDYLWRTDDHAQTMREIRRWSAADAEAYERVRPADGGDGALHQAHPGHHAGRPAAARPARRDAARRPAARLRASCRGASRRRSCSS